MRVSKMVMKFKYVVNQVSNTLILLCHMAGLEKMSANCKRPVFILEIDSFHCDWLCFVSGIQIQAAWSHAKKAAPTFCRAEGFRLNEILSLIWGQKPFWDPRRGEYGEDHCS